MAKGKSAQDKRDAEGANERRSERVGHWQDGWATGMNEGMSSAGRMLLERGNVVGARSIYDEILRRFDTRCGCRAFLDLDAAIMACASVGPEPPPVVGVRAAIVRGEVEAGKDPAVRGSNPRLGTERPRLRAGFSFWFGVAGKQMGSVGREARRLARRRSGCRSHGTGERSMTICD